MTDDEPTSESIRRVRVEKMLPLYEAKMLHQFDHRSADVVKSETAGKRQNQPRYLTPKDHQDPFRYPLPQVWVDETELPEVAAWLTGFSDVTSATNERTILSSALPRSAVGHTYPLYSAQDPVILLACLNSFALDYVGRQKVAGLHLTYTYVKQFPVIHLQSVHRPSPWTGALDTAVWLRNLVSELSYTAWDMAAFAKDVGDIGPNGRPNPPFIWDEERRSWLRAELDAAFFHLYGIARDDVDYIMDTFPIVRRKDEAAHGEYRTKNRILQVYDAIAEATRTGQPYESVLDPPPGQGPRHPQREEQT